MISYLMVSYLDQGSDKSQNAKEIEKMHTKELKRILNKVDEMRRQRLDLHTELREQIAKDDLTRLLVTATSECAPLDRLFADQLSKHQSLVSSKGMLMFYILFITHMCMTKIKLFYIIDKFNRAKSCRAR